jgi:hypothetical protein
MCDDRIHRIRRKDSAAASFGKAARRIFVALRWAEWTGTMTRALRQSDVGMDPGDRPEFAAKILPKCGSYDNIEELSADLILRQLEVNRQSRTATPTLHRESRRCKSPAAEAHGTRQRRSGHKRVECDTPACRQPPTLDSQPKPRALYHGFIASSTCEEDDSIAAAALPPSHSKWLFGVSWLCFLSSLLCVYHGSWDFLCVPLGVGINSVNYWRKPDYGWRRYVDIVYIQLAIPFAVCKAMSVPEPYRTGYYTALISGICVFANACRLCQRPADGRWSEYLGSNPTKARRLAWSTFNHFMLHLLCNIGNCILTFGLHVARSR